MKKTRIFINGFGRIGRSAARIILEDPTLELVGINDLYSPEQMAYLLKYDSVYETLPQDIRIEEESLWIDTAEVAVFSESNPSDLDLTSLHIDVMLQCSGIFLTLASNQPYINNGAGKVVVSTPPSDTMPTYICGVNADDYAGEPIISNSSCSANAIVPIFKVIEKLCGIRGAQMHMFHSYTAYQNLLDVKHYGADIRRARAAAVNIIPLSSSAAKATTYFFPALAGNLHAKSIRIPVAATTMYDLLIKLEGSHTLKYIKEGIVTEVKEHYRGILDCTTEPKVSSDYIANTHSATIDLPLLDLAGDNLLRVSAWQDNEYGYACRLVEMAKVVSP
jgi:glyceraldehyde 3-phosphate dehydrogenase